MSMTRRLIISAVCAVACSQAQALLSVNVLQDDTTVPGWVINTFTVDTDTDLTATTALSNLTSGSMLQVPGFFLTTRSNGVGDSYLSINNDLDTISGLGAGDLGGGAPTFDETGIGMTWLNTSPNDIGTGLHLATLTLSDDATGYLEMLVASGQGIRRSGYLITDGFIDLYGTTAPPPIPDPPIDPNPLPDPGGENPGENPGGNPGGNPGLPGDPTGDGNPIPEPAGLGLIALIAVAIGGLHRRRLVETGV